CYDSALADKKPGKANCFIEKPTAVSREIQYNTIHCLKPGFGKKFFHVFITRLSALFTTVKRRQIDYTEPVLPASSFSALIRNFRLLFLHVDLVSDNGDVEAVLALAGTQDGQGHPR